MKKTDFRATQRALARAVNHGGGLDKLPLSNDALRPLAMALVDIGRDAESVLTAFQIDGDLSVAPIYLGFIVPIGRTGDLALCYR